MHTIGKILPIEGFEVYLEGNPPINYAISLTHLYQPLIGMQAIMLYQTLLHEARFQTKNFSQTHHTLMNYLDIALDDLYKARLKLEGIGLLTTFQKDEKEGKKGTHYTYVLKKPFSPREFFKDPMLSELLSHHIGLDKVEYLRKQILGNKQRPKDLGENVTASFSDVFQTFQPSFAEEFPKTTDEESEEEKQNVQVDFSWIQTMLKQRMIPEKRVLTRDNKKLIGDMILLYQLTTYEIEKALLWALTEEHFLDREEFKEACHDTFQTKNHQKSIQLMLNPQVTKEKQTKKPETKEEKLIYHLETISPKQLLEDLSGGNRASAQDLKIIREVMTNQGLPHPVMNVLIHYVLLQSDMRLSKAYLETIASHWSRAGLQTAEEAMAFARKQIMKYRERKQKYVGGNRKQASNEVIPEWFHNKDRQATRKKDEKGSERKGQENQQDLEALIQEFAEE